MNKEEILNKYIDLIDKGYCSDCNELNCIDNFPHAKIAHAIRELQQENKQLKDNWNKLKEYIEKDYGFYDKLIAPEYGCAMGALRRIKDEMQELEQGSDNNVKDYNVKD